MDPRPQVTGARGHPSPRESRAKIPHSPQETLVKIPPSPKEILTRITRSPKESLAKIPPSPQESLARIPPDQWPIRLNPRVDQAIYSTGDKVRKQGSVLNRNFAIFTRKSQEKKSPKKQTKMPIPTKRGGRRKPSIVPRSAAVKLFLEKVLKLKGKTDQTKKTLDKNDSQRPVRPLKWKPVSRADKKPSKSFLLQKPSPDSKSKSLALQRLFDIAGPDWDLGGLQQQQEEERVTRRPASTFLCPKARLLCPPYPSQSEGVFPDPADCTAYHRCVHGRPRR